jgi:hypothetical protein
LIQVADLQSVQDRLKFTSYFEHPVELSENAIAANMVLTDIFKADEACAEAWDVILFLAESQNGGQVTSTGTSRAVLERRGIDKAEAAEEHECLFGYEPDSAKLDRVWAKGARLACVAAGSASNGFSVNWIAAHELGHVLASLDEEYELETGETGAVHACDPDSPLKIRSDSRIPNLVALTDEEAMLRESYWPWAGLINTTLPSTSTSSSSVGGYEGGGLRDPSANRSWHRSQYDCAMGRDPDAEEFCVACKRALLYAIRYCLARDADDIGLRYRPIPFQRGSDFDL